ncbi:MAG: hypothetical protein IPK82_44200 [Polyangiaceae bacterium]|nr:hypothetical protein [Polyangiaceae bacterium]
MPTTVGGRQWITTSSNHTFAGPPAVSNIPPMTPPKPDGVPAPFPYIGRSATGKATSGKLKIGGGKAFRKGSSVSVDPPGNQPSQPAPLHDLVTMMVNKKMFVR